MATAPKPAFKHIVVLSRSGYGDPMEQATKVTSFLNAQKLKASALYMHDDSVQGRVEAGEFDLVIAVGGDGTVLRAGHWCAPLGIPLLGINDPSRSGRICR